MTELSFATIQRKHVFIFRRFSWFEETKQTSAMSIIYSLIARGTTVLVDYTETTGNFQQITGSILQKIPLHDDTKCTYVSGRWVVDSAVYLCLCNLTVELEYKSN